MPDATDSLLRRLIGGDPQAITEILQQAPTTAVPALLVAAALLADEPGASLARAGALARSTRDRQLVAIAEAHLDHDVDRLDVLVRDHLADHPDNLLAAWIAAQRTAPPSTPQAPDPSGIR
jgi:hypothetical protein